MWIWAALALVLLTGCVYVRIGQGECVPAIRIEAHNFTIESCRKPEPKKEPTP